MKIRLIDLKKIIIGVLVLSFLLCSCNKGISKNSVCLNVNSINTVFILYMNGEKYKGTVLKENDKTEFCLVSPEELKGVIFYIDAQSICCRYGDVEIISESDDKNVFVRLNRALDTLKSIDCLEVKDNTVMYKNAEFEAYFDSDGNIESIQFADSEFVFV